MSGCPPTGGEHQATVRPLAWDHVRALAALPMRPIDRRVWGGVDLGTQLDDFARRGPAFAVIRHGAVLALAGVMILRPGVGEAWCVSSALVERHPLALCRAVRRHLARLITEHRLHRVQALIHQDHLQSLRWAGWLGFAAEGRLKAYGSDRADYHILARIE